MGRMVELPLWLLSLIVIFAAVTFASHFLLPSVRWYFRRRLERVVARLNTRLDRPIQPFKLARRHDMIQRLIYDPGVARAVVDHARETGVPEQVAFEQASRYAREIVPSFSASAYFGIAIRLARWLSNALYRVRLGHQENRALAGIDPEATVVFVMNHRSNMDYVLVTYLAAERSALSYAVGEWARIWPLSGLIRSMGAYFIRRSSRSELYRRVLARYVALATEGGVTQAMFPEGGLSLTGGLAPPKLGLLKYIAESFEPDQGRDIVFVPIALNYDRVLEDQVLVSAGLAGTRRFDASALSVVQAILRQVWLRATGRFHRFGYAAVSFGDPLSMRGFAGREGTDVAAALADELMQRIARIVPVLPVPLVALVLREQGAMPRDGLVAACDVMGAELPGAHLHIPRGDPAYGAEVGLRNLLERGIVHEDDSGLIGVVPGKAELLDYYANSIAHLRG